MKLLQTTESETIKVAQKAGHNVVGVRTEQMVNDGVPMKKFPLFNGVNHNFIEVDDCETISIRTPNGKMISLYLIENGDWANIDIKVHNEDMASKVLVFQNNGDVSDIEGSLYAFDIKKK